MNKRRAFFAWWGSFVDGGPTVGDLLAVKAACSALSRAGWEIDIGCSISTMHYFANSVSVSSIQPHSYKVFVWVCGPLIPECTAQSTLLSIFNNVPKVAAGVSVLKTCGEDYRSQFSHILARDGPGQRVFDFALAEDHEYSGVLRSHDGIGISMRGKQREYGLSRCNDLLAGCLVEHAVEKLGVSVVKLETRLDRGEPDLQALELGFARRQLVITTRLHGALLSIKYGVPFVAIDQVQGGEKVWNAMHDIACPWVYRVGSLSADELLERARELLAMPPKDHLNELYRSAKRMATDGTRALVDIMNQLVCQ